jgi:hypothetical protein
MASSIEGVLREVLDACSESVEAGQAAVRRHFTEDCVWHQTGFPHHDRSGGSG